MFVIRVCLSFNKKLRCRLKKPSARRKTQLIAGLFTSFTTTTMAFLGTTRRGGLLFCPLCVKKTLFRMTKRQFFCLDWAKNKLRRCLLLKDKQTLVIRMLTTLVFSNISCPIELAGKHFKQLFFHTVF